MTSHYDVLRVDRSANAADIRAAFRQRALEAHPDKGGNANEFRAVIGAFEVLGDAKRRLWYDTDVIRIKPQVEDRQGQPQQEVPRPKRRRHAHIDVKDKQEQFYCQVEGILLFLQPESRRQGIASLSREQRSVLMERALHRKATATMPSEDSEDDSLPETPHCFVPKKGLTQNTEDAICQFKGGHPCELKKRVRESWIKEGYFVFMRICPGVHCKTQSFPNLAAAVDMHCLLSSIRSACSFHVHTYDSLEPMICRVHSASALESCTPRLGL